jgi:5-methylcytosine-specific restriction endonuclease McrA
MKNLTPFKGSYLKNLENIIDDKYEPGKTRLNTLKPKISKRYFQYQRNYLLDALETISSGSYTSQEQADLENCYSSTTASFGEIVKQIKESQHRDLQGTCQYCGIQKPNTIDHYLPKSDFPEFSVLALNLIPCCGDCNTKKNNYWLDKGFRGIINFYIDNLPQIQFLFCDITIDSTNELPNVNFRLTIPKTIDKRLRTIINNHFKRLDLCNKYLEFINDFITDKINSIVSYLNSNNPNDIKDRIGKEAINLKNRYGINNWRTVLTDELSKNVDFIQLIRTKMPSKPSVGAKPKR